LLHFHINKTSKEEIFMISIRNYKKVESLEEAYQLNQQKASRIIGGMLWIKMGEGNVNTAIDLSGLGLDTIQETEDAFELGCMVTLRQLETHPGLLAYTAGAMREAVRHIVGVQFRNAATLGGSIYGRYGFSDVLTMFLAMDSYVELYQGGVIPLKDFAAMNYDRDILVRLIVKKEQARFYYTSVRNSATDFPVLTCAGALVKSTGQWCMAVGARPGRALLYGDDEGLLQGIMEKDAQGRQQAAADYGAWLKEQVPTDSNLRGSAQYRSHLVEVLAARTVKCLSEHTEDETYAG
jgi:CO/xanthine dehydrogenase FAD-binding subunit